MALHAGERLGPYDILGSIGSGGMGEVYRARDLRLEREVAVKVLPAEVADDPERLRRFEQEARASGSLSHPNILVVHDVGSHGAVPFLVTELLEGETLRQRIEQGPLPIRRAVEYTLQVARGLAAAHDRGIVHRDLKPENLFLTNDGVVKILDFGLARLDGRGDREATTETPGARPGVLLGTVGYMSPEQVQGLAADHRSDLFALGAVLYEMLSGSRAFRRATSVETLNAILKEEPADFPEDRRIPPALDRVVRHCLEKKPQDRFQSARDLVFELEGLAGTSATGTSRAGAKAFANRRRRWLVRGALGLLAVAAAAGGFVAGRQTAPGGALKFQRLTYRRGTVWSARFTPDGQTVVYGAAWEGQPIRVFTLRPGNVESRPMDLPDADVLAISSRNELALSLNRNRFSIVGWSAGTLARAPLGGGSPRALLEDIRGADWSPDGQDFAIVRESGALGTTPERPRTLEYPTGTVLATGPGIICPRVSPRGDRAAFADSLGVQVVDRQGNKKPLTPRTRRGPNSLVWSPKGDEIWFGASFHGDEWAIYGVDLQGHMRVVAELPFASHLLDVRPDGRALLTMHVEGADLMAKAPGAEERNVSWLDWSNPIELSQDGRLLLLSEPGQGGARTMPVYLRDTDGSRPAVLMGERGGPAGEAHLSPDGRWLLLKPALPPEGRPREFRLQPVGPGETRTIPVEGVELLGGTVPRASFLLPDDRRVAFSGREPGRPVRSWILGVDGGRPRAITPERQWVAAISPDGAKAVARDAEGRLWLHALEGGGDPRPVPGPPEPGAVQAWSADGQFLFTDEVDRANGLAARVFRRDLATGRRELWKEVRPADQTGLVGVVLVPSADGRAYAYSVVRSFSSLYLVEGLQ